MSVKTQFHKCLVQWLIINLRLKPPTAINIHQAEEMLMGAWWNLKMSTISNCWRKAGLIKVPVQLKGDPELTDNSGDLRTEVAELLPTVSSFEDYVDSDSAALTAVDLTTEEILNNVRDVSSDDDNPKEDDCGSPNTEEEAVSNIAALARMNKVRTFTARSNDVPNEVLCKVEDVEAFLIGCVPHAAKENNVFLEIK
ncbi:hypothetical protein HPB50_009719 [Hyalomma asiaticum]|uniref:Uncharacterized protein n=1 Tax=Hyalomma asiaticum TaxID=266040 RepID=A0ACB7TI75_HYAAI|nr:hypothetical protein HPB50_009719 [Hyalomma asiaticum]